MSLERASAEDLDESLSEIQPKSLAEQESSSSSPLNKALPSDRPHPLRVFIQVNTSGETSKSGLDPLSSASDLDSSELAQLARYVLTECPKLWLEGLMTIGALELSLSSSEVEKNADFEKLKETRDVLDEYLGGLSGDGEKRWGREGLGGLALSMGMSSDFEAALKAGSDIVRVGTGIFGQRVKKST
ncbi:uncharacterized protein LACBIDRAFT_311282 [Laccaria bicolor S238N-H82]|uniref:Predicted protein n=1 Tax=Laccaria bicolor (strain S238N-H82 / ATCC MYA-4686) TaxID=486041 RepID=B0CZM9_LACBS|nr:uncharacterized protein LACBIDRAFT_311282 [Laccaria bicolor S238N-H82]EDR12178.1 predicted protein [Laccaria bicolor S238N-H82]|eukprot:XP_001876442.1 predicted protein [Laccaria bicolor S238N-H82]